MSDFEQCLNGFQLDMISILVNFWYELGKLMTRYDMDAIFVILSNVWTDSQLTCLYIIGQLVNLGK